MFVEHSEVHRSVLYIRHLILRPMMTNETREQKAAMGFDRQYMLVTALAFCRSSQ